MESVDPEDGPQVFREPPPQDDRLWRHPSEMAGARGGPAAPASRSDPRGRQLWLLAGTSAVAASLLTAAVIAAIGALDVKSKGGSIVVEKLVAPTRPTVLASTRQPQVTDVADQIRPAVAQLRVHRSNRTSSGSGVIFRSDGQILTNHHVVDGATSIDVVLASGRHFAGRIVGTDRDTDTAVVKIDGDSFPVVALGTAANLRVGQTAITVSCPVGVTGGPSVTVGVVSGLHRKVSLQPDGMTLVDMVQTDAPVAPGSSGGALVDDQGAVIGITTVGSAADDNLGGLAFATPIDTARSVADQLVASGKVSRGWLGVEGDDLDDTTASQLSVTGGALVAQVSDGSPAQKAGLAAQDVIIAVDGSVVRSMGELVAALQAKAPGQAVTLDVMRDHDRRTMNVVLAQRPN
jgi:S1-C subfamily serine protease